jgi:hypothetical protein
MMVLASDYHMACEMPEASRPLPVLKVFFRNAKRIQEKGGRKAEVLHFLPFGTLPDTASGGQALQDCPPQGHERRGADVRRAGRAGGRWRRYRFGERGVLTP